MTDDTLPVELDDALVEAAHMAAANSGRTVAGQLEHWARLGKAFENSGALSHARIRSVLSGGGLKIEDLTGAEQESLFAVLWDHLAKPSPEIEAFYASLAPPSAER